MLIRLQNSQSIITKITKITVPLSLITQLIDNVQKEEHQQNDNYKYKDNWSHYGVHSDRNSKKR